MPEAKKPGHKPAGSYKPSEKVEPNAFNVMFLDIETVPTTAQYENLTDREKAVFTKRFGREIDDLIVTTTFKEALQEFYQTKASLNAEYGKVACISFGIIARDEAAAIKLRLKSFCGRDEAKILKEAAPLLGKAHFIGAHNGKGFDFAFLGRRYLANGLRVPSAINAMGKRPWDMKNQVDTMEMWTFAEYQHKVSLDALAMVFGLPSPKGEMDGSQVFGLYYADQDAADLPFEWEDKLKAYCEGDVITNVNVFLKMIGDAIIEPENIVRV